MSDTIKPRTMITTFIVVLFISVATSSICSRHYFDRTCKPQLNQYAQVIQMETLTLNALIRILVEKGIIGREEINLELNKITTELEKILEEAKNKDN